MRPFLFSKKTSCPKSPAIVRYQAASDEAVTALGVFFRKGVEIMKVSEFVQEALAQIKAVAIDC